VVEAPFLVWVQGVIVANIAAELEAFVRQRHLGEVVIGAGFILERHPDTVRGPNVSFVRKERIPKEGLPQGYFKGAPDLAVEVFSPWDTASQLEIKVHDYLRTGTQRV
jgi:Uma2 family endonuclease